MSLPPNTADEELARQAVVDLAGAGPFDLVEAVAALGSVGVSQDAGSVLALLEERQVIVRLGGEPQRWELVID